ncbi:MAG: TrkA C-terminal domain-containing protein [Myxococcota bacterium]
MTTRKTELPGVGTKHTLDLEGGGQLVAVEHRVGHWELARVDPDGGATPLIQISREEASDLGRIMAREESPAQDPRREMLFRTVALEWLTLEEGSPLAGKTLTESEIRPRTGASVIAVLRGEESMPNPPPDLRMESGDTLVVLGRREQVERFLAAYGRPQASA